MFLFCLPAKDLAQAGGLAERSWNSRRFLEQRRWLRERLPAEALAQAGSDLGVVRQENRVAVPERAAL